MRANQLIKTRGCRVDLDEVEAALCACDNVVECAVFPVRGDDETFAVHAVARANADAAELTSDVLVGALRDVLPAYAVPMRLDVVEEFPRTSTNKIDRRKLRERAESRANTETQFQEVR